MRKSDSCEQVACFLYDAIMNWIIDRLNPAEESVYLHKANTRITRKISVPGAVSAWLENGFLVIGAATGYLWTVNPDTGHRRRRACSDFEISPEAVGLEKFRKIKTVVL